jgi:ABC-type phosphate transport system substrate-binding protein
MDVDNAAQRTDRRSRRARGARRAQALLLLALASALIGACGGSGKSKTTTSSSSAGSSAGSATTTSTSTAVTGSETAPGVITAAASGITATMHATTHHPKVGVPWPISFTVEKAHAPVQAKVVYEYLFGGNVVAKRSNYAFRGHFSDRFLWPGNAVGYPLTFRAVITALGQTLNLDYPVQVTH